MIQGQVGKSFSRKYLEPHLKKCRGKTLGELDKTGLFASLANTPRQKGVAGDVVEQSVLDLEPNPKQEPDIVVDGVKYEVKTTGVRKPKKGSFLWEAKEPMSITAVSPESIVSESYSTSHFWEKIAHLLFFYYHYDSTKPVTAFEYSRFPLLDYQFHEHGDFSLEEQEMLEGDWNRIRKFIRYLQENYKDKCEAEYPRISHDLRQTLMLLDTAPKWPNRPRFRFKRSFVSSILQRHFAKKQLEELPEKISDFMDLDDKCYELEQRYRGKTVGELCSQFGIKVSCELKSIAEPIIIHMFDGKSKSMREVAFFHKVGVWGKSFVVTKRGGRTEDAKFFTIDFDEIRDPGLKFEDSQFYEFFSTNRLLVAVFEEPAAASSLTANVFVRFKTIVFDEDFIYSHIKPVWERIRELVLANKLKDVPVYGKNGRQIRNKNGELRSAPNFPKSSEGVVFVRGTGNDSKDKRECVNGVRMYYQQVWIRGDYIATLVSQAY